MTGVQTCALPIFIDHCLAVDIKGTMLMVHEFGKAMKARGRGAIVNIGSTVIVRAHVPLKEMFGYISDLRSMTKGRASFTMQFHHYDPVPRNIADEIMAKSA